MLFLDQGYIKGICLLHDTSQLFYKNCILLYYNRTLPSSNSNVGPLVPTFFFVNCSFALCLFWYFSWLMHREIRITPLIFMAFLCEAQPSPGLIISLREASLTCTGDTPQSVFNVCISRQRDRRETRWCDKVIMHRNLKRISPHHSVAAEMKISHDNASTHLNKKIVLVVIAFICFFILLLVQKVHPRKKKLI